MTHLLGDFILQPDVMVQHKRRYRLRSFYLYIHIGLHGILAGLFTQNWLIGIIIAITHLFIDAGKLLLSSEKNTRLLFLADQALHFGVIAAIVLACDPKSGQVLIHFITGPTTINLACCLVFLTLPTSIIIKVMISGWTPNVEHRKHNENETPLMNAGKYIGILERLFVFSFVITEHFEAIGFLLAAKSVFRFGDLKNAKERNLTEYVLIGTLLSFGFAIATGWLYTRGIYFNPK